jgi:Galactosyltransferase
MKGPANMPRILILILSTVDKRYDHFKDACKRTWVKRAEDYNIKCLFYEGNSTSDYLVGNELRLAVDDSLANSGLKLFKALEFIDKSNIEYDYIFRTNLSSYIYIDKLINWIGGVGYEELYAGVIVTYNLNHLWSYRFMRRIAERINPENSFPFASGAGFWISKKNIHKVLGDNKINFKMADDPMVGYSLHRHGVRITPVSRIDFNACSVVYRTTPLDSVGDIFTCYHIRCYSDDRQRDAARFFELDQCHDSKYFDSLLLR